MRQPENKAMHGGTRPNTSKAVLNTVKTTGHLIHPDYNQRCLRESTKKPLYISTPTSNSVGPSSEYIFGQYTCVFKPHLPCSWIDFLHVILSWLLIVLKIFIVLCSWQKSLHIPNICNFVSLSLGKTNEGHEYSTSGPHQAAMMEGNWNFSHIFNLITVGSLNSTVLLLVRCFPFVFPALLQVHIYASFAPFTDIARGLCPFPVTVEGTQE